MPVTDSADDQELTAARQLHRRGVELCDVGQLSEAREVFVRALDVLHLDARGEPHADAPKPPSGAEQHARDEAAARILLSLALPTSQQERVKAGLAVLADADAIAARVRLPGVTALICCQRGLLLLRTGRRRRRWPSWTPPSSSSHAAPAEQFKIMMNRGDSHHLLGNVRAARHDFAAALDIARDGKMTEFEFGATHNLGFMAYLEGDLPKALSLMPTPAQATSDYARGVVGLDRAKVLLAAGLFAEADETCAKPPSRSVGLTLSSCLARRNSPGPRRRCEPRTRPRPGR